MGSSERRARERERFRQLVLDAARDIARSDGWKAVTIRRIADKLEFSGAALYEYFPNKEAILHRLLRDGFRQLADVIDTTRGTPYRLLQVCDAYWQFAFRNPDLYQVMHGLGGIPFGTTETPAEAVAAFVALREAVTEAMPDGGQHYADLDAEVDAFWSVLHGIVSLAMAGRIKGGEDRAATVARRSAEIFLEAWQSAQDKA